MYLIILTKNCRILTRVIAVSTVSVTYQFGFSTISVEHIPVQVMVLVVVDTQWALARILDRASE